MRDLHRALILLAVASCASADSRNQAFADFVTPLPLRPGDTLVIGVVGGWERWDNPARCIRRTAIVIKRKHLPHVYVETVENHKLELAEELVRKAFDFNRDGTLTPDEARQARVIVFGQSLGGRAAIWLCRTLNDVGVPVRLAVIVDAWGKDSYVLPPNVREAANYYQSDHIVLKGAPEIRAADPAKTTILGNWRFRYQGVNVDTSDDTEVHRIFMGSHTLMEYDRRVWDQVEQLLISRAAARD